VSKDARAILVMSGKRKFHCHSFRISDKCVPCPSSGTCPWKTPTPS